MTIIVASIKEGRMVSDSMALDGDEETWIPCTKVFRARGHLIGFAGSLSDIRPLVEWYRKRPEKRGEPPPTDDTEMLILEPGKLSSWTRSDGFCDLDGETFAIGAGKQIALAALEMGADARKAAQLAVKYSAKCAGRIVVRNLCQPPS